MVTSVIEELNALVGEPVMDDMVKLEFDTDKCQVTIFCPRSLLGEHSPNDLLQMLNNVARLSDRRPSFFLAKVGYEGWMIQDGGHVLTVIATRKRLVAILESIANKLGLDDCPAINQLTDCPQIGQG